ncbi:MAG: hypothetical protein ACLGG0_07675 [Bacteriovoracia bacterium]
MRYVLFFIISLVSWKTFAVDPYKLKPIGMLGVCDDSYVELKNLPPVRDQGNYGLCYAHSSVMLIEYHRCSKSANPSNCYRDAGSVLHLARFNSYYENSIQIGGHPGSVLNNFRHNGRKLSRESCAAYTQWQEVEDDFKAKLGNASIPVTETSENDIFYRLWAQLRKHTGYEARECWAQELINAGLDQNLADVMNVLNKVKDLTWQELRFQLLVPKQCLQNQILYPDFDLVKLESTTQKKRSFKEFRDQVFRSLKAGAPLEASFCSSLNGQGKCNYHSATIIGQRHVCNRNDCELQFRIQNSYGKRWQENYDDGWVNAENLANLMAESSLGVMSLLPKGAKLNNALTSPYYVDSPISSSASKVPVPGNSNEQCWKLAAGTVPTPAIDKPIDSPPTPSGGGSSFKPGTYKPGTVFRCKDSSGKTIFTDSPPSDMSCKPL